MPSPLEAYLDIETTGLYSQYGQITVAGLYLTSGKDALFRQLVGEEITAESLLEALRGVVAIYTYNGSRFDLPFISCCLGIDLARLYQHCDLMYHCWRKNLHGGLKNVERQLGIGRQVTGIDGRDAVRLWWQYVNNYDRDALYLLLRYNKEDVVNLKTLRDRLLDDGGCKDYIIQGAAPDDIRLMGR